MGGPFLTAFGSILGAGVPLWLIIWIMARKKLRARLENIHGRLTELLAGAEDMPLDLFKTPERLSKLPLDTALGRAEKKMTRYPSFSRVSTVNFPMPLLHPVTKTVVCICCLRWCNRW